MAEGRLRQRAQFVRLEVHPGHVNQRRPHAHRPRLHFLIQQARHFGQFRRARRAAVHANGMVAQVVHAHIRGNIDRHAHIRFQQGQKVRKAGPGNLRDAIQALDIFLHFR